MRGSPRIAGRSAVGAVAPRSVAVAFLLHHAPGFRKLAAVVPHEHRQGDGHLPPHADARVRQQLHDAHRDPQVAELGLRGGLARGGEPIGNAASLAPNQPPEGVDGAGPDPGLRVADPARDALREPGLVRQDLRPFVVLHERAEEDHHRLEGHRRRELGHQVGEPRDLPAQLHEHRVLRRGGLPRADAQDEEEPRNFALDGQRVVLGVLFVLVSVVVFLLLGGQ
mmetsp:Transcript_16795/g.33963  ORF Transcript_16795/g.33963 Transcript_16795/m.33963 type:complete len:224 (-) Transcript_16795:254-925(-)